MSWRRHDGGIRAPGADDEDDLILSGPHDPPPAVDDRLAPPEARIEYVDGSEVFAAPANGPHAMLHADLSYVLRAHVKSGYRSAVDMLTRTDLGSDVAPDASVFSAEADPETGGRQIERLAFEISSEQTIGVPTIKARKLAQRGVRRVFCILVKKNRMMEWDRDIDGWRTLPAQSVIEDPCLAHPLKVAALLDATAADDAVVEALRGRRVPALERLMEAHKAEGKAEGRAEGKSEGKAEGIIAVLTARGIPTSDEQRGLICGCRDEGTLTRWLARAATVSTAEEVLRD